MDVPWIASFVISGLVLRVLTIPFHVASERMLAKRFHISNYFVAKMFQVNMAGRSASRHLNV